jgi:hypothetical protein
MNENIKDKIKKWIRNIAEDVDPHEWNGAIDITADKIIKLVREDYSKELRKNTK